MTTKVVDMEEALQKLFQFQFLLKKRKLGICDKMVDFVDYVQVHSELIPIATLQPVSVAHTTILINDQISVAKYLISTLKKDNESNKITITFKKSFWGIGTFLCFVFRNATEKKNFLDTVGDIETGDESNIQETTPPTSEEDSA